MISNRDWYYLQQQRKRRREQDTPEQRYFRTNSGTTDYVQLDSAVTGIDSIELTFSTSSADAQGFILGVEGSYIRILSGTVRSFRTGGANIDFGAGQIADGKLHRVVVTLNGANTVAFLDGVQVASVVGNAVPAQIDRLCMYQSGRLAGVMSDVKITSAGVPINHWPMNEGSGSTHVDVIGGNNGTVINGTASDWELFTKVGNTWVGSTSGEVIEIAY